MARMSKDEYDALVKEIEEQRTARLTQLASDPAEWVTFITEAASFGARYSLNNQFLLMLQAYKRGVVPQFFLPYGTYEDPKTRTKPKSGWVKEGRVPRAGETAFRVWAPVKRRLSEKEAAELEAAGRKVKRDASGRPAIQVVGFRLSPTFELSQTDGEPFEVPTVRVQRKVKAYGGKTATLLTGEDPTGAFDDIVAMIKDAGYTYELVPPHTGHLGTANGVTVAFPKVVQVRDDVDPAQRFKTTVHELAHILCGHLDGFDYSQHRGQAETEAESVAHIVSKALGLDTEAYSDAYVLGWANGDIELVKQTAETVLRVAKQILTALAEDPANAPERELELVA